MIDHLSESGLYDVALISLDNDLERISTVRNLIVRHIPGISISSLGVQILRNGRQLQVPCEVLLKEILKAASVRLCGSANSDNLCLELVRLRSYNQWIQFAGIGVSVLRELPGGATLEVLEESTEAFGVGPLATSDRRLNPGVQVHLSRLDVKQIQLDVIQPCLMQQAVLVIATKSDSIALQPHSIQSMLRETRQLLELASLIEFGCPVSQEPESLDGQRRNFR